MHFADINPKDIPPPPSVDEVARLFSVPMMSFVAQPSLQELAVGTTGSSSDGGETTLDSVSLTYTLWRNPRDRNDPMNLADLSDSEREALDAPHVRPLPDWMMERRELMRYPMLWEAVLTTRKSDAEWQTPESTLVRHVNHVVTNTFREQRVVGGIPGELDSPVTDRHIQPVSLPVDGAEVPAMQIDSDPNVYAVGADLGDRIITAVVSRDHLSSVTMAFETRGLS